MGIHVLNELGLLDLQKEVGMEITEAEQN